MVIALYTVFYQLYSREIEIGRRRKTELVKENWNYVKQVGFVRLAFREQLKVCVVLYFFINEFDIKPKIFIFTSLYFPVL